MVSAVEGAGSSALNAALVTGLNTLSANETITFTQYFRVVLPLDGYVFWVKGDILSQSAVFGALGFNKATFNQSSKTLVPAKIFNVKGSLHVSAVQQQEETQNLTVNTVIFTAERLVNEFNEIGPNTMWIAELNNVKYAFSRRGPYYQQANLFHYSGEAVYPDMNTQIIDNPRQLDTRNVVVSDSLPLWLKLNNYDPVYGFGNHIPLYPSFLLPRNIAPPFASVHVVPESSESMTLAPLLDETLSHSQLTQERVKITLWGLRNFNAMDFLDCVYQYSRDYSYFGIMNLPALRDEKRTQVEMSTIAMKKSVEFQINYHQTAVRQIAQQILTDAVPTYQPRAFAA